MQQIVYTCNWCHTVITAERANQLTVNPAFVPVKQRESVPSYDKELKPIERAERRLKAMEERDKEDSRRSLEADICDSCFAQLPGWIECHGIQQ